MRWEDWKEGFWVEGGVVLWRVGEVGVRFGEEKEGRWVGEVRGLGRGWDVGVVDVVDGGGGGVGG